eukprot:scaffold1016_cov258-Pinguiococcus_pyrenoidosus.AAC.3
MRRCHDFILLKLLFPAESGWQMHGTNHLQQIVAAELRGGHLDAPAALQKDVTGQDPRVVEVATLRRGGLRLSFPPQLFRPVLPTCSYLGFHDAHRRRMLFLVHLDGRVPPGLSVHCSVDDSFGATAQGRLQGSEEKSRVVRPLVPISQLSEAIPLPAGRPGQTKQQNPRGPDTHFDFRRHRCDHRQGHWLSWSRDAATAPGRAATVASAPVTGGMRLRKAKRRSRVCCRSSWPRSLRSATRSLPS